MGVRVEVRVTDLELAQNRTAAALRDIVECRLAVARKSFVYAVEQLAGIQLYPPPKPKHTHPKRKA